MGWNRAFALAIGSAGAIAASVANVFRNLSSGPKTTEGWKMVQSSVEARTAASPSPLLRWYIEGPVESAPSELMCR